MSFGIIVLICFSGVIAVLIFIGVVYRIRNKRNDRRPMYNKDIIEWDSVCHSDLKRTAKKIRDSSSFSFTTKRSKRSRSSSIVPKQEFNNVNVLVPNSFLVKNKDECYSSNSEENIHSPNSSQMFKRSLS